MEVNCGAFFGRGKMKSFYCFCIFIRSFGLDVLEGALNPDWIKKLDERHREEDIRRANIENLHRSVFMLHFFINFNKTVVHLVVNIAIMLPLSKFQ